MCFWENICGAFLQKQLQDVFIHDLNFFFQINFDIFYLLGQLSLLALLQTGVVFCLTVM